MKKTYIFGRAVLLFFASAALFACKDDELGGGIPGGNGGDSGEPEDKPKTDYTLKGIIANPEGDKTFVWSAGDEITLWDVAGKKNNTFAVDAAYEGNTVEATFGGSVNLDEANALIALYPKKEGEDFAALAKIEVNDTCKEMRSEKGNLITYMAAKGELKEEAISDMTFSPLTALVKFSVSNSEAEESVKVNYITISSEDAIFSSELTLNESGVIDNVKESYNSVTLDMQGKELVVGIASIDGFLSILPTKLAAPETKVCVTVNVNKGESAEQEIIPVFDGTLKNFLVPSETELQNEGGETTESMIKEGSRYNVSIDLKTNLIPDAGFDKDEEGNVVVYTPEGLLAWVNGSTRSSASAENVRIETKYLPNGVMDFKDAEWTRKDNFIGTFDGNGVVFSNLRLKSNNGYTGLFGELAAGTTVKNVTLKNLVVQDVKNGLGLITSVNKGTVENCVIDGGEFVVSADNGNSQYGLIVGELRDNGLIKDCKLTGNIKFTTNQSAGGVVGKAFSANSKIIGTCVDKDVEIISKANANVGGFVGTFEHCKIYACAYLGTIHVRTNLINGNSGGFIGDAWVVNTKSLEIAGCYSAGKILLEQARPASMGGFVGNGEGASGSFIIKGCYSMPDFGMFSSYDRSGAFLGKANTDKTLWDCDDVYNFSSLKHSGLRGQYPGITDVKSTLSWNLIMSKMNSRIPDDVKYKFERNPEEGVPFILVKTE